MMINKIIALILKYYFSIAKNFQKENQFFQDKNFKIKVQKLLKPIN